MASTGTTVATNFFTGVTTSLATSASGSVRPSFALPPAATSTSSAAGARSSGLGISSQLPIFACTPASYNITGGTPPYLVYIINSGVANAPVLKTLPAEPATGTFSWGCDISPGTSITFAVLDSTNRTEYSSPIVMQASTDLSCLPSTSSSSHTGAIVGGVVGGVVGLALIALLAWAFIIRPAKRARSKGPDFYDAVDGDKDVAQVAGTDVAVARQPSLRTDAPVGSYNIGGVRGVDLNPESLDALEEQRHVNGPPSYEHTGSTRLAPPVERPPLPQ